MLVGIFYIEKNILNYIVFILFIRQFCINFVIFLNYNFEIFKCIKTHTSYVFYFKIKFVKVILTIKMNLYIRGF